MFPNLRHKTIMAKKITRAAAEAARNSSPSQPRRRSEAGDRIRQRIKAYATELFIRRGYNGVTLLDLAKELGINHSLVHYHFGTKAKLAEEVLREFAERGIRENQTIWGNPDHSLFEKFVQARDRMYRRFILFNPGGTMQHPTGLVSRFSMDAETLGPELRLLVRDTQEALDHCVSAAVQIAIDRGELRKNSPAHLIMLQISSILFVAGPSSRYGWEFPRLDDHFRGALETLMLAYGVDKKLPALPWPKVKRIRPASAPKETEVASS